MYTLGVTSQTLTPGFHTLTFSSIQFFQTSSIRLRIHISLCKCSLRVSGVKWNFIVAVQYDAVAFVMSWLWDPFLNEQHKLLPRALGLAWQMKIESEMVEMAVMRAEEKQTELMEPRSYCLPPPPFSSSTCNPEEFWEMWTGGMEQDPATQTKTSASLDCKNSSTFSFDGWNMKDSNWDRKLCLKGPQQIELAAGQRPACRLLSHDRCTS